MAEALTSLLEKAQLGDSIARDAVYKLAFHRLRSIAAALLGRERPGHTLQPTALVSELFLKLHRFEARILSEDHFFRLSARAMRQVLIDHARTRKPAAPLPPQLHDLLGPAPAVPPETALAARIAFEKLRAMDREVADTVWLRFVEGLTVPEIAAAQNRESWRVRADSDFGLQWLAGRLRRYA
jgi:RNA polymerase sigma factor (TIGR02999 family)